MDLEDKHTIPGFSKEVFVATIEGAKTKTLRSFYTRIAKILHFPDYFGENLDALLDSLCSLEVVGSEDIVLLIQDYDQFLSREKNDAKTAVMEVLQAAENPENRYDTVRFRVIAVK
jgi:RNAse (barnase) inhibitor barstar